MNYNKIFVNWLEKYLQRSDVDGGQWELPEWQQYESRPIELAIVEPDPSDPVRSWSKIEIDSVSLKVSLSGTLDSAAPFAQCSSWTKDLDQNVLRGNLDLNTSSANSYISSHKDSDGKCDIYCEFEIVEGTSVVKIVQKCVFAQGVVQPTTTAPDPSRRFFDVDEMIAQFVRFRNDAGQQVTLLSPNGNHERTIGVDDNGRTIEYVL